MTMTDTMKAPVHAGIQPTEWQSRVLKIPEVWNLLLEGGRGPGKTHAMALRILRHLTKYGTAAKVLILRENYKGLQAIEELMVTILDQAFPGGRARFNKQEHMVRIADGGTVEFGQLESHRDVSKYMGRETTLLCIDEAGLLREMRWVQLLKSNLRSPADIPLATIMTANPGGSQHQLLQSKYISAAPAWHPFVVEGETWVHCAGTYLDNPYLNHADYKTKILASCSGDEALAEAWLSGSWNIARGAFFADCLSEATHMLPSALPFSTDILYAKSLALDWGTAAPCVTLFGGYLSDSIKGVGPKGTLIIFDELSTHRPDDISAGLGWPPSKVAESIREICARYNMAANGVGDDAVGLSGNEDTLLNYFRTENVYLTKPAKGRIQGWAAIRNRLIATRDKTGKPGLMLSARCSHFWQTAPFIIRDPRKPDDLDSGANDHSCDALRYFCNTPPAVWRYSRKAGE
ncbi:MAG: phage terminase large subunit [Pseudolabrys sp.]|nr:phage terminase large subunit [Pseudolabrys sp.]